MISGRQTRVSIDTVLATERRKIAEVEVRMEALSAGTMERQQEDAQDSRELARVRGDMLASG